MIDHLYISNELAELSGIDSYLSQLTENWDISHNLILLKPERFHSHLRRKEFLFCVLKIRRLGTNGFQGDLPRK